MMWGPRSQRICLDRFLKIDTFKRKNHPPSQSHSCARDGHDRSYTNPSHDSAPSSPSHEIISRTDQSRGAPNNLLQRTFPTSTEQIHSLSPSEIPKTSAVSLVLVPNGRRSTPVDVIVHFHTARPYSGTTLSICRTTRRTNEDHPRPS